MREPVAWEHLGRRAYRESLAVQEARWQARRNGAEDVCLAVEHPPTITFGLRATLADLLVSPAVLEARGIACAISDRGGGATYHGPGQLVLYPVVGLAARAFGVRAFVSALEEIMIEIAAAFGVRAGRDARGRGVWTARGKLGAVGIRVRDGIATHGLALNVNPDLTAFRTIAPCSVPGLPVTSLAREGSGSATIDAVLPLAEGVATRLLQSAAPRVPEEVFP